MTEQTAILFDVQRNSYVDGPGIRTTVFFKGCNMNCAWCHNPESQFPNPQMMVYQNKCTGCGKCKEKCPHELKTCVLCGQCTRYCPHNAREICGKAYTLDEVLREIRKDKPFYEASGGGVTFSGGECMLQIDFLEEILKECKRCGLHTAVDTAGQVPFASFEMILPYTDLFLYDVKCYDSEKHKQYTGVGNELILENLARLLRADAGVWVRIPIIAGINDSIEDMTAIRRMLDSCGYPERVELLPYHAMGEHKYAAIGKKGQSFSVPDTKKMMELRNIFL